MLELRYDRESVFCFYLSQCHKVDIVNVIDLPNPPLENILPPFGRGGTKSVKINRYVIRMLHIHLLREA